MPEKWGPLKGSGLRLRSLLLSDFVEAALSLLPVPTFPICAGKQLGESGVWLPV